MKHFVKICAFIAIASLLFACKTDNKGTGSTNQNNEKDSEKVVKCYFSVVDNAGGSLTAKIDGKEETSTSPIEVKKGQTILFTATPNEGWEVESWTGVSATEKTATLEVSDVSKDLNVAVKFKNTDGKSYTISWVTEGRGIIIAKNESENKMIYVSHATVKAGVAISLKASHDPGWLFEGWEGEGYTKEALDTDGFPKIKIVASKDTVIKAKFVRPKRTITFGDVSTDGKKGGTVTAVIRGETTPLTSPASVEEGKEIIFEASMEIGYKFVEWEGASPLQDELKASLVVGSAGATVTAKFAPLNGETYTIAFSVVNTEGGKLEAKLKDSTDPLTSPSTQSYGKRIIFTATPETGYVVKEWKGVIVDPPNGKKAEIFVSKNMNITVEFVASSSAPKNYEELIEVPTPTEAIVGKNSENPLPNTRPYYKGVFIEGRSVKLSPYKIGKYEVAYKLWKEVFDWAKENGYSFANNGLGIAEEAPVINVTWRDAIIWCNAYTHKKNNSEAECVYRKSSTDATVLKNATRDDECDVVFADISKKGFRLPTDAEWEFAARYQGSDATNATAYGDIYLTNLDSASGAKKPLGFRGVKFNGAVVADDAEATWEELKAECFRVAVFNLYFNKTQQTDKTIPNKVVACGSKDANALGIHDMAGNAYEWCFDLYEEIKTGVVENPIGPETSEDGRILRGGSIESAMVGEVLVGYRMSYFSDNYCPSHGFRVVCTK